MNLCSVLEPYSFLFRTDSIIRYILIIILLIKVNIKNIDSYSKFMRDERIKINLTYFNNEYLLFLVNDLYGNKNISKINLWQYLTQEMERRTFERRQLSSKKLSPRKIMHMTFECDNNNNYKSSV